MVIIMYLKQNKNQGKYNSALHTNKISERLRAIHISRCCHIRMPCFIFYREVEQAGRPDPLGNSCRLYSRYLGPRISQKDSLVKRENSINIVIENIVRSFINSSSYIHYFCSSYWKTVVSTFLGNIEKTQSIQRKALSLCKTKSKTQFYLLFEESD